MAVSQPDDQPIGAQVREIVEQLKPGDRQVTDDSRLVDDLAFNSLALLELMFACEDEFGLPPIDEVSAVAISTVGDVISYVAREVAKQQSEDIA